MDYECNEYLFMLIEYIIDYFKNRKSKLYLKVKNNFKTIINEYFELINNIYKLPYSYEWLYTIFYMHYKIFIILEYNTKYDLTNNIDDIIKANIVFYNLLNTNEFI